MEFLVTKKVIHRDLAARNILVDHNKNTKISDFGLSRNLGDIGGEMYEQKTKGPLPIRWMAPESLYFSVFTPKSDVWGFGILMWEIVTLGSTPYPGMGAREVMRRVRDGYRLERPAHCHPQLYNLIIQKCWSGDMNKRPDFSELRKELAKLLEDQHGYIDLQNIPENKYYSMEPIPDEEEKL
jgi:serine/threonine protein kinase